LKLSFGVCQSRGLFLSALDPGKQGLKHGLGIDGHGGRLSALDPGKQGLKHDTTDGAAVNRVSFSA